MKVILTENVEKVGKMGQTVEVKDGYARNYLLPRKLAVAATAKNLKAQQQLLAAIEKKATRQTADARVVAENLARINLSFTRKAGEGGRLFGSVTNMDIAEALAKEGFIIDRKDILTEPLKGIGDFKVTVRLHHDVNAEVAVTVNPEAEE